MLAFVTAVLFAVVVSAACSIIEAVLYAVPQSRIQSMVDTGRRTGLLLQGFRRDIDRPIAGILSLNTIANTAGAAIAGAAAADVFGPESFLVFSAVFTLTILIASEVIPKTAGVVYSRNLASWIAYPLQFVIWIMTPMIWICRFATRLVPRKTQDHHPYWEQELRAMIRLGESSGSLDAKEARVMNNILSLETKTVKDIMTPRTVLFTRNAHASIQDVRDDARSWSHSRIPVYDRSSEDIVGIVLRREVLLAIGEDRWTTRLSDLMRPVDFVLTIHPLDRLLERFLDHRLHLLVALDEHGGLAGVVTLEDLLEEILGHEIVDESDRVEDLQAIARARRERTLGRQKAP